MWPRRPQCVPGRDCRQQPPSFRNSLEQAARYFADDSALTVSLDATAEQFQTAVNEAREDERRRLAREIHDGPAQVLSNAIYAIQTAEQYAKRAPEQVADQLVQVREYLREGMTEVRRFMFDLQPTTLQDLGLAYHDQRYVEGYARFFGRRATCTITRDPPLAEPRAEPDHFPHHPGITAKRAQARRNRCAELR